METTKKRSRGAQPGQQHALKQPEQRKTVKLSQLSVTQADAARAEAVLGEYEDMIDLVRAGFLAEVARREQEKEVA